MSQVAGNLFLTSLWYDFEVNESYLGDCIKVIGLVALTTAIILCLIVYIADIQKFMRQRDLDKAQIFERMSEGVLILTPNHQDNNRNLKQFPTIKFFNRVAKKILSEALGSVSKLSGVVDIDMIRFVQMTAGES